MGEPLRELHILRFADGAALDNYRNDPELVALRPLRDASVISTEITAGVDVKY